jgi:hypothetical protein
VKISVISGNFFLLSSAVGTFSSEVIHNFQPAHLAALPNTCPDIPGTTRCYAGDLYSGHSRDNSPVYRLY